MMGRTTLREVRDALTAARAGEAQPLPVTTPAGELEALARRLEQRRDGPTTEPAEPDAAPDRRGR